MNYIADYLQNQIIEDDLKFQDSEINPEKIPLYDPKTHYLELTHSNYFHALIVLRHYIKLVSDYYFSSIVKAKNIDLFMFTPSISSPMGPGSDSLPLPIKFGKFHTNLVDSSQFGFEPLLLNGLDKVYCYLPSMRGEDPDYRHLNQFFHCEAEIIGTLGQLTPIIENYVKTLAGSLLNMPNILKKLSRNYPKTVLSLNALVSASSFPAITFDDAVLALTAQENTKSFVKFSEFGRDISAKGEIALASILSINQPFWIRNYDRDRVAFYQKPIPNNKNKVFNADLIFPPLMDNSFGGEIVGCGQRQDNAEEMIDSLARQNVDPKPYEWYINIRKLQNYQVTSGFGMGIERFISWCLCLDNIRDAIIYPRLKDVQTYP